MGNIDEISYFGGQPEAMTGELIYREIYEAFLNRVGINMNYLQLSLFKGNNKEYIIYVKDQNLTPVNLTGAVALMTFKKKKESTTIELQLSTAIGGEGVIAIPTDGEIRFYLTPDDTEDLDVRQYVFDVSVTTASAKKYTVLSGVWNLFQSYS